LGGTGSGEPRLRLSNALATVRKALRQKASDKNREDTGSDIRKQKRTAEERILKAKGTATGGGEVGSCCEPEGRGATPVARWLHRAMRCPGASRHTVRMGRA
jgi:hypothetical protein